MTITTRRPENRLSPLTGRDLRVQADEGRQTPRRMSFGDVLVRGVQTVLAGAGLLAPAAPGGLGLVASVGAAAASGAADPATAVAAGAAGLAGAAAPGSEAALLQQQEAMRARDRMFNLQYLELQRKVQDDQRQFQVLTNLLKTQHDTVKTAINNLR